MTRQRVETAMLCADGSFPASQRFMHPAWFTSPLRCAQELVYPAMDRQGTMAIEFYNPWGWTPDAFGNPIDPIDLAAFFSCRRNPTTKLAADVGEIRAALEFLKSKGYHVAMYLGSPYAAKWQMMNKTLWAMLAKDLAGPFVGLVDRWDVDMLSTSDGADAGAAFAAALAFAGECEVGGDPRQLPGKRGPSITVVTSSKFKRSGGVAGDPDHLPLSALTPGSEVHVISGKAETLDEARAWVQAGVFYQLSVWEHQLTAADFLTSS